MTRLRTWLFALSALLGMLVGTATMRAQGAPEVDKAFTSGLALGTGVGADNVVFGGHALYYLQTGRPRLRVALHVGAGTAAGLVTPAKGASGVRGGAFLAYGKRNRLVLGLYGGTMAWSWWTLHYTPLEPRQLFGAGLSVGWEWMTRVGFYMRATVGPIFYVLPQQPLRDRELKLSWEGNLLSLGYKLW